MNQQASSRVPSAPVLDAIGNARGVQARFSFWAVGAERPRPASPARPSRFRGRLPDYSPGRSRPGCRPRTARRRRLRRHRIPTGRARRPWVAGGRGGHSYPPGSGSSRPGPGPLSARAIPSTAAAASSPAAPSQPPRLVPDAVLPSEATRPCKRSVHRIRPAAGQVRDKVGTGGRGWKGAWVARGMDDDASHRLGNAEKTQAPPGPSPLLCRPVRSSGGQISPDSTVRARMCSASAAVRRRLEEPLCPKQRTVHSYPLSAASVTDTHMCIGTSHP